ncbi:MAG: T9SS type A sorting domain-containing protein [Bacteroidota bacterium]
MKLAFLILFLSITTLLHAQIVNFTDSDLKDDIIFTYPGLDANNDGEIQVNEAQAATSLSFNANYYASVGGIEAFTNITELHLHILSLTELDLSPFQYLTELDLRTDVETIDVSMLTNIEHFRIYASSTSNVIMGTMTNLKTIEFLQAPIVSVDLTGAENLENAFLSCIESNNIQIGYKPHLTYIYVDSYHLTNLDLSGCPVLVNAEISVGNSTDDIYVNLKNGYTNFSQNYMDFSYVTNGNPNYHCYVCIDEGEELMFTDEYVPFGVVISPYCTFEPGGRHNKIMGSIYLDENESEILGFSAITINGDDQAGTAFSNNNGYNFYPGIGTFTLSPQIDTNFFTVNPESAVVTFIDIENNVAVQNFSIAPIGNHADAEVVIVPLIPPRPGFDSTYKIVYKNNGNQTLNGDVTFMYDDAVLDYVSATPVETASATGSITWSYTNLQPFESREVMLTLNVNSPMETPAVNIDDVLNLTADITPLTGDETPENNVFGLKQVVVGSFDPNDITCLEGEMVHPDMIGHYLHYNINFENTGTAPATFIVVKDVIDETQFDLNTLQMINTSHDVEVRRTGNKVEFYFDDISLAGNGGKGNVAFKIKSLSTLAINDDVSQEAEIFFDYNWPIETNEATTIFALLSTPGFEKDSSIKVYPNPAGSVINIAANNILQHVELYDMQGRLLQAKSINGTQDTLDISSRSAGIYFVKIFTEKGVGIERVMKI